MATLPPDPLPNLNVLWVTRAHLRDAIRRKKGITPPVDNKYGAVVGQEPAGENSPTNPVVNQAIADAIRTINRETGFHGQHALSFDVDATSDNGPQFFELSQLVNGSQPAINQVRRVEYVVNGIANLLIPTSFYEQDRRRSQMGQYAPGNPVWWFTVDYTLAILPGSNLDATLNIYAGTGLVNLNNDYQRLEQLPVDYQEVIEDLAVVKLCMMQPNEPDAQAQIQLYGASAAAGIQAIKRWHATLSGTDQPKLTYVPRRRIRTV